MGNPLKVLSVEPRPTADLSIAVITNDPPEVLAHFVAAHLVQGVKRIFMFFDNPNNAFIPIAQVHPQIIPTICNNAFWKNTSRGKRPTYVETRQFICYRLAYLRAETEWIGFCDADEIMYSENGFDVDLTDFPLNERSIRAHVCEAVWPEDAEDFSAFSAPMVRRHQKDGLEGVRSERFLSTSKLGMMGHTGGKYVVRTGIDGVFPGIHVPRVYDDAREEKTKVRGRWHDYRIKLIHFDAISYDAWHRKHQRRNAGKTVMIGNPDHRRLQSDLFAEAKTDDERLALFRDLYAIPADVQPSLVERGLLLKVNFHAAVEKLRNDLLNDPKQFAH